jgi:hypothetical protein
MKKIIAFAALGLLTSSAWAIDSSIGENEELYGSPLLDHSPAERAHAVQREIGDNYGSLDIRQSADHVDPTAVAESYHEPVGDS